MSTRPSAAIQARTVLDGLVIGESPRWRAGRLWFAHWGTEQIVAADPEGNADVVVDGVRTTPPPHLGWSIDWLPDGGLLVTGEGVGRLAADGSVTPYGDLGALGVRDVNEIVVDGRGNAYVDGGVEFHPGEGEAPGFIALVTPDGSARRVAEGLAFPNGMVVSPDNGSLVVAESFAGRLTAFDIAEDGSLSNRRVWADGVAPDGICMDAEGAIWTGIGGMDDTLVGRVVEGGEVLDRVKVDLPAFACMLGGDDGRTLFALAADWRMAEGFEENIARLTGGPRTGLLQAAPATAPRAGWP